MENTNSVTVPEKAQLVVKYGSHAPLIALTQAWSTLKTSPRSMILAEAKDFASANEGLAKAHAQWVEAINLFASDILDSKLFADLVKAGEKAHVAKEATLARYVRVAKAVIVAVWTGSKAKSLEDLEKAGNLALDTANDGKPVKGYTAGNRKRGNEAKAEAEAKAKAEADIAAARKALQAAAVK
mgnify:CR=1 FL=1